MFEGGLFRLRRCLVALGTFLLVYLLVGSIGFLYLQQLQDISRCF